MTKTPALLFCSLLLQLPALCQDPVSIDSLKQQISQRLAQEKGYFAIAFRDLTTGKELFIHEHELFHAASTMKTPVLIEVYRQAARGKFKLSDSIEIRNEFKSIADGSPFSLSPTDDSEFELYKHTGEKRTIDSLVYLMITVSSNLATNLLIDLVGAKNVMHTMRKMGAKDILVLRGVEDQKAFDRCMNNKVTAFDLMLIFDKMAREKLVSREASEAMIRILMDQHFSEVIPARLPSNVNVAHKTGSITGVHHDSGIVFLPDGRKYVLVILSKNLENEELAVKAMAEVSEMFYKYLNP